MQRARLAAALAIFIAAFGALEVGVRAEEPAAAKGDAAAAAPKLKFSAEAQGWLKDHANWPVDPDGKRSLILWEDDDGADYSDDDLAALQLIPEVNCLRTNYNFTENGLAHLRGLKSIEYLTLDGGKITNRVVKDIATMSNLRELELSAGYIGEDLKPMDDEGLAILAQLPHLQTLNLGADISVKGLRNLEKFPELRKLTLYSFPELNKLNPYSDKLRWKALAKFPKMAKLETLDFQSMSRHYRRYYGRPDPADTPRAVSEREEAERKANLEKLMAAAAQQRLSAEARGWVDHPAVLPIDEKAEFPLDSAGTQPYMVFSATDDLGDGDLAALWSLPKVNRVWVRRGFSESGLAQLRGLPSVEYLTLGKEVHVTDQTLATIARMPNLLELEITQPPPKCGPRAIDDEGFANLSRAPRLKFLKLEGADITDAGLRHVESFAAIKELHLSGTKLTWDCLAKLTIADNLDEFELTCPPRGAAKAQAPAVKDGH